MATKPGQYGVSWKSAASGTQQNSSYSTKAAAVKDAVALYKEGAKNIRAWKYSESVGAVDFDWRIGLRNSNPIAKKPTPAQLAARKAFAAAAKAGTLRKGVSTAPKKRAKNPVIRGEKTKQQLTLVGSVQYAVLYYHGKTKPTGRPDIVFPARDKAHAMDFAKQLEEKGASGVILIEKTENRVS